MNSYAAIMLRLCGWLFWVSVTQNTVTWRWRTFSWWFAPGQSATKSQMTLPPYFALMSLLLELGTCRRHCCEEGFMEVHGTFCSMSHMIAWSRKDSSCGCSHFRLCHVTLCVGLGPSAHLGWFFAWVKVIVVWRTIGGETRIGTLWLKAMLLWRWLRYFSSWVSTWSHCHIGAAEIFFDALSPSDGFCPGIYQVFEVRYILGLIWIKNWESHPALVKQITRAFATWQTNTWSKLLVWAWWFWRLHRQKGWTERKWSLSSSLWGSCSWFFCWINCSCQLIKWQVHSCDTFVIWTCSIVFQTWVWNFVCVLQHRIALMDLPGVGRNGKTHVCDRAVWVVCQLLDCANKWSLQGWMNPWLIIYVNKSFGSGTIVIHHVTGEFVQ